MRIYFAHPITMYNTPEEYRCLVTIKNYFPELKNVTNYPDLVNPNQKTFELAYKRLGMDLFLGLVDTCDIIVYSPFNDNTVGAGVVSEVSRAVDKNKKVYKIDPITFEITEVFKLENCLTVEETREKIKQIKLNQIKKYL